MVKCSDKSLFSKTVKVNCQNFLSCIRLVVLLFKRSRVCVCVLQKGQGVDVDGELTTLLSTSYLRENFDFADTNVKPVTKRVSRA